MLTRGRVAHAQASPSTVLFPLPNWFVHEVFLLLPADQRLRCSEVSRAWRALLAETSLWSYLDLSEGSGYARFSEALFRAAIAKAGGQLRELDVLGLTRAMLSLPTLLDALASNATTLKLLLAGASAWYTPAELEQVVDAAPLSVCYLSTIAGNVEQARRYLRNEPSYERLRLTGLVVLC